MHAPTSLCGWIETTRMQGKRITAVVTELMRSKTIKEIQFDDCTISLFRRWHSDQAAKRDLVSITVDLAYSSHKSL
jgi:uncharacterized protein YjhX (UPF0386 family)